MKREEIGRLYDHEYAASYDEKFLLSPLHISDTRHEVELLRSFLTPQVTWLDVACGTGYFLRQFPEIPRAGIDLSPAMLERAALRVERRDRRLVPRRTGSTRARGEG